MIKDMEIIRVRDSLVLRDIDQIVEEIPLTIFINQREVATLYCSPIYTLELAVGVLFDVGYIKEFKDIQNIKEDKKRGAIYIDLEKDNLINDNNYFMKRFLTSDCLSPGILPTIFDESMCGKVDSDLSIDVSAVFKLMKDFISRGKVFLETGGTHSAALAGKDGILFFNEDIGRHNAIDKVIGWALIKNLNLNNLCIISSGRVSSSSIVKLVKAGVPIITSRSAPTVLAVELAKKYGVTLIGFVRGGRMNIYSNSWRVKGI